MRTRNTRRWIRGRAGCGRAKADDAILQHIAGVSPDLAARVRSLNASYQLARAEAPSRGPWQGEQSEDPTYLAYHTYSEAMRQLGQGADLYAGIVFGDGFNRFQGHRLVRNEYIGQESDPLYAAQILEAQKQWADDRGDDAYATAFLAALDRAITVALHGNLTVSWS